MATSTILLIIFASMFAVPLAIAALVYMVVPVCKGISWLVVHLCTFIFREIGDVLRVIGGVLTTLVLMPLTVANVLVGRWSGAGHYGRAVQTEVAGLGAALYRIVIGHPARLLCLQAVTEGIEKRVPQVVAAAPAGDRPPRRIGQFEGYSIIGSLPGGGSGGKLYIAEPTPEKRAGLARAGAGDVDRVVIKCFSLRDGSSLPQIVRENRALPAAKRLGLILEHELTEERFHYVMKYVPGESLSLVTQRLHAESGGEGLGGRQLREAVEYGADLARTLCHYHAGGLWHKDVKPDNIIVAGGQAHLVDFGLITPLRSSLTLTTHGTEYFRDPEMVRLALRGVKVHEVDGAKFDIYAAGAVLYSVIENSFPAHGGLSQITRRCPEALRWIVRRAMADYDKRYPTAAALLADLEAVAAASDPFALKPAMLPSFTEADGAANAPCDHPWEGEAPAAGAGARGYVAGSPALPAGAGAAAGFGAAAGSGGTPRLRVTSWWTGRYTVEHGAAGTPPAVGPAGAAATARRVAGATAAEQLARARQKARAARARAHSRMKRRDPQMLKPVNAGVGLAVMVFLVCVGFVTYLATSGSGRRSVSLTQEMQDGTSRIISIGPGGVQMRQERTLSRTRVDGTGLMVSVDPAIRVARQEGDLGGVMVLRDPVSFDSGFREQIEEQVRALGMIGFKLRGDAGEDAEAGDPGEEELVADLRNELGLTAFQTADARERVQEWLERFGDLSMLVWIGRGDGAEPAAWVIGRKGVDRGLVDAASAVFERVER